MARPTGFSALLAGTLLWAAVASAAVTYYVAPDGHNANPGTEGAPWRDIQKAADTMVAGDTVYIKAGTYAERVVPTASGTAGNLITYAAYPGHVVTIDGSGVAIPPGWGGLFEISGRSYIEVSGLHLRDAGPDDNHVGILVEGSSHVTIESCSTTNTASSGIGVWGSEHVVIAGNEIELACNDGEQECLTVAGTDIFEVRDNWVHHGGPGSRGGEGIDVKDGSSNGKVFGNRVEHLNRLGIYVDAWDKHTYNIAVFQNLVSDCAGEGFALASEAGGLLENVRIYNNVAYRNQWVGLTIGSWGEPVPAHPIQDVLVINNTFHDNGWSDWGGGISVENPDAVGVVLRNNIVSQNQSFQIQVDSGVPAPVVDHNLIDGFRGYPGEIWGADHIEGNPGFVNSPAADYHLAEGSPAIDAGSSMAAPADDFDGVLRPQGAGYDIGAYELGQGAANPTLTVTKAGSGTGTVTSNPAGINCGADCSEPYPPGTQVSLSIAPAAGSTFAGWSGGGCSGTSACVVTLNSSTTVTATFNAAGVRNCTPNPTTLCLNSNRFKVQVDWETGTGMGEGQVVPGGTGDSSNLWFFSPNNWEMLFKVLDGCAINNHYWVFFAATTDVGFTVTVTDTQEDEVTVYGNPLGQAATAVTDTSAFATCP